MAECLVTGATGFLGSHLIDRLQGSGVRTLVRESLPDVDVETVEGSILDADAVARAVDGIDTIYHLAGKVSRDPDDVRELYRVHVEGTTTLCRAAKSAGVKRIVLASTSGTIAVTEDGKTIPDESAPPPLELIGSWPYYTSKLYQEEAAKRECQGGPEIVILNPSLLLGPGDKRLSSTEDVLRFLARDIPVIPPGGVNFVDVRDVADAFVSAMERGRSGERYLLGGPNWTFKSFFERLERISKVKGPRVKLPESMYSFAGMAVDAFYRQLDKAPPVDKVSVEMGRRFWYLDPSKATRELGFEARDPYETLHETVAYINREILGAAVRD
jgi:dihydroflavonol-4-reductase